MRLAATWLRASCAMPGYNFNPHYSLTPYDAWLREGGTHAMTHAARAPTRRATMTKHDRQRTRVMNVRKTTLLDTVSVT